MPLPAAVVAAVLIGAGMLAPHVLRAATREAAKAGVFGEGKKKAVERIESSPKIQEAMREAWENVEKKIPGVDVPVVGRVTAADIPVIGMLVANAYSGEVEKELRKSFGKRGIKYDSDLLATARADVVTSAVGENLGMSTVEVGAAGAAASRVASIAGKEIAKKGIINLANKEARGKLVSTITREAAIAGAAEGAAGTAVYYGSRRPEEMRLDNPRFWTDVATGAGVGALMSGVAGAMYGTMLTSPKLISTPADSPLTRTGKNVTRTIVDWSQEIIDVQEKFGDIVAEGAFGIKGPKVIVTAPTTTTSQTGGTGATTSLSRGGSPAINTTQSQSGRSTSSTQTQTESTTQTSTQTSVTSTTPTTGGSNPTTSTSDTPITDDEHGGGDPTFSFTSSDTQQETPQQTPVPTSTPFNTPSVTPSPNWLPMPLIPKRYAEGPVVVGTAGRKVYVNELTRLRKMIRDMMLW